MKIMTEQDLSAEATRIFTECEPTMSKLDYLKRRWDDEKEYEDWSDYEKQIRFLFETYTIVKVLKVGVVLRTENFDMQIKVTTRHIGWKITKLNNVRITP